MRRIAFISADPGVPVFGRKGASVHVQEVIRALRGRGIEVVLFAARLGAEPPSDLANLEVLSLPDISGTDLAQRERSALALNPLVARLLDEHGPFDAVYERHSLWSFAAMEWAKEQGIAALLEVNAPLLLEQAQYRTLHDLAAARESVKRAYAAADAIFAVSEQVAGYIREFAGGLPAKVHVVPNGVDPGRFAIRERSAGDAFTIGFVGTLKPWHGVEMLVETFAKLHARARDARLLIVGDGPQREGLESMARDAGLDGTIEFTGAVDPAAIPAQLARMDVAVAPYPRLDNFYFSPLKVYEYMAAGCGIVASAIGQITEVLEDGVTALLYPPGDVDALAGAIERLRTNVSLRRRLAAAARSQALAHHTWDSVARRILELAEQATSGMPGRAPVRMVQ